MVHTPGSLALFFQLPPFVLWPYVAGLVVALVALFATRGPVSQARGWEKLVALTPLFLAPPLAAFGAEHLTIPNAIAAIVPAFMPWHLFWTYFVGCCLILAGLSIASNIQARWAETLLGIMFFLFVAMMDIPGVVEEPHKRLSWILALREFSFGSGAWALAATQTEEFRRRGTSWMIVPARFVIPTAVIFYAVLHFLHPAILPGVPDEKLTPAWYPGRFIAAYATGAVLGVAGIFLLLGKRPRMAATYLGGWFLLLIAALYVPMALAIPAAADGGVKLEGLNFFFDTMLFAGTVLALANAMPERPQDR